MTLDLSKLQGMQVPELQPKPTHAMAQLSALAWALDENGLMPIDGGPKRTDYVDAMNLLEMIRQVVREEIDELLENIEDMLATSRIL